MSDLTAFKHDKAALLRELQAAGCEIRKDGKEIKCGLHGAEHFSASVYQAEDGAWKFRCHSAKCGFAGDIFDVISAATNRKLEDVIRDHTKTQTQTPRTVAPKPTPTPQKPATVFPTIEKLSEAAAWSASRDNGRVTATYKYTNPKTAVVDMIVFRIDTQSGKRFIQARPTAGGYEMRAPEKPWPLYNRTRVATSAVVVFVEGEKSVHALTDIGFVATTAPGGAGKIQYADLTPLAGKTVYLWPDCDPESPKTGKRAGIEHMRQTMAHLQRLQPPADVWWIDCDELGFSQTGEDVVDYLAQQPSATLETKRLMVEAVLEIAEQQGPAAELRKHVEDAIAGKRKAIEWPWPTVSRCTRALLPGTLTVLCGPPGATKSFWLLEALAFWFMQKISVALMALEEDRKYHLSRSVAQQAKLSLFTSEEWLEAHPDDARAILQQYQAFSQGFGACISEHPDDSITPETLIAWVRERAICGCRIIAIDPITMMEVGKDQWVADLRFVAQCKQIARQYGCSIILVTHPKKNGTGKQTLDDLAGGTAYQRFAQTVIWLEYMEKSQTETFEVALGRSFQTYNRMLMVKKARNSWGGKRAVGFWFNSDTFCSEERGLHIPTED